MNFFFFNSAVLVSRLSYFCQKTAILFFWYSQGELKGGNHKAGTNFKLICYFASFEVLYTLSYEYVIACIYLLSS